MNRTLKMLRNCGVRWLNYAKRQKFEFQNFPKRIRNAMQTTFLTIYIN